MEVTVPLILRTMLGLRVEESTDLEDIKNVVKHLFLLAYGVIFFD